MNNESDHNKAFAKRFGITEALADEMTDFSQKWTIDTVNKHDEARFHGYGKFVKTTIPAGEVRHPKTGVIHQYAASVGVRFEAWKGSKEILNAK